MAEAHHTPDLIDVAENPVPPGGTSEWLSLEKGKVLLRFASWPAPEAPANGTVILATGRAEFIEKYFEVVRELRERGFAVAAFDWRGQGGSSRLVSDPIKGHVANFDLYVDDLQAAVAAAAIKGLPRPFYLLAHSMGGAVALMAASHLADQIERMVLTAPMLALANKRASSRWAKGLTGIAGAMGLANRQLEPHGARPPQDIPFDDNVVTSDPRRYTRTMAVLNAAPELSIGGPTVKWFNAANRAMRKFEEPGAGAEVAIPTLMVVCGTDKVVSASAIERFAKTLHCGGRVLISGARHEILMERTAFRTLFWAAFDCFIPGADLRLPTDIAPPKTAPALVSGDLTQPSDAAAPAASETAERAPDAEGDVAVSEEPAPVPEPVATADATPSAETPTPEEPPVAEPATAKTEAAATTERRTRFGFFRRRGEPAAPSAGPATEATPIASDQPASESEAAPESETTATNRSDAASETTQPTSAEAALAAAASLVAEATRGETPRTPLAGETDPAKPEAETTPQASSNATAPEPSETPAASGNGHARIGRLFRRRTSDVGEDTSATDEAASGEADTAEQKNEAAEPTSETDAATPASAEAPSLDAVASAGVSDETSPVAETAEAKAVEAPVASDASEVSAEETTETEQEALSDIAQTERDDPEDAKAAGEPDLEAARPLVVDTTAAEPAPSDATDAPESEKAAIESDETAEPDAPAEPVLRSVGGGRKAPPRPVKRGRGRRR
ncbi:alpha/beta fold hydrolase [Amorphus sp. 3PC139-8]|uniref:alpha/beta fold hydrolase n=1 Tax=Amorphus sp. 3PC139-8 TaxID=2735676 RepID=UPI00345C6E27